MDNEATVAKVVRDAADRACAGAPMTISADVHWLIVIIVMTRFDKII